MVSTTAPINKKQKKVGMKYLARILWESSLVLLVQCSLAFLLYTTHWSPPDLFPPPQPWSPLRRLTPGLAWKGQLAEPHPPVTGNEVDEVLCLFDQDKCVRKLDLSQLCFSLNFYFLMFLSQFPSMFPLLTYSQSFFSLSADHPRHSRRRRSNVLTLLIQETV